MDLLNDYLDLDVDATIEERVGYDVTTNEFKDSEQRYVFSDKPKRYFSVRKSLMTKSEKDDLVNFYVSKKGDFGEFQVGIPNGDGTYTYWKVRFATGGRLSIDQVSPKYYAVNFELKSTE